MDKKDIIEFFDRRASSWDAELIRNDEVISIILDNGGIKNGVKVLDVACGTGVLIPDYLEREVESVTGIDISPEMIAIAKAKFKQDNVSFICGDVETAELPCNFDCCMVYNAFPPLSRSGAAHSSVGYPSKSRRQAVNRPWHEPCNDRPSPRGQCKQSIPWANE